MWISKTRGGHSCPQNDKIPLPWASRGLNNSGSLPRWLFKHSFDDELEKTEHCRSIATSMHDDTSVLAPYTHNASSYRRFTITFPARDVPSAVKGEMDENVLSGFTALPSRNTTSCDIEEYRVRFVFFLTWFYSSQSLITFDWHWWLYGRYGETEFLSSAHSQPMLNNPSTFMLYIVPLVGNNDV